MRLSFAATNPCHVYDLARELSLKEIDVTYYSGYPKWKLQHPRSLHIKEHSIRTLITYGLLKVPYALRPSDPALFKWQDTHFDQWVSKNLEDSDIIHGLPGQCLETFKAAKSRKIITVLNHASGPLKIQRDLMQQDFARRNLDIHSLTGINQARLDLENKEWEQADHHCVASSVVKNQLTSLGVSKEKVTIIPYGADPHIFTKKTTSPSNEQFTIVFAGALSLRKQVHWLIESFLSLKSPQWKLQLYGPMSEESASDLSSYFQHHYIDWFGPVSQNKLAKAFREAHVVVLPSVEEAFGLVIVQALQCGTPCIVSNAVGAADLITEKENGSVFPVGDRDVFIKALQWWEQNPKVVKKAYDWSTPASLLADHSQSLLNHG